MKSCIEYLSINENTDALIEVILKIKKGKGESMLKMYILENILILWEKLEEGLKEVQRSNSIEECQKEVQRFKFKETQKLKLEVDQKLNLEEGLKLKMEEVQKLKTDKDQMVKLGEGLKLKIDDGQKLKLEEIKKLECLNEQEKEVYFH